MNKEKIKLLEKNRDLLAKMSINSFNISQDDNKFGENGIRNKWKNILNDMMENKNEEIWCYFCGFNI